MEIFLQEGFNQLYSSKENPECVVPGSNRSNIFAKFSGRNCRKLEYPKNVFLFMVSRGVCKDLNVYLCLGHCSWYRTQCFMNKLLVPDEMNGRLADPGNSGGTIWKIYLWCL